MKKRILITTALIFLAQTSFAQEADVGNVTCIPIQNEIREIKYLKPRKVEEILSQFRMEVGDDQMQKTLGEPTLKSLETYAKLDDRQLNANMYVAAAAAGAAVAVVDYLWARTVGNGPKKDATIPDDYFDIIKPRANDWVANDRVRYSQIEQQRVRTQHDITSNPVALTPAVAAATVGAVAYRAAEYSLKKVFGNPADKRNIYDERYKDRYDERSFDLSHSRQ